MNKLTLITISDRILKKKEKEKVTIQYDELGFTG